MSRISGILCPVFSLPSPYGIGTLGKEAFSFVDFLSEAGQSLWQVLPEGPVSYGNSPYQTYSIQAGNPYFIDLTLLMEEGLLTEEETGSVVWSTREDRVDYDILRQERYPVLRKAFERASGELLREMDAFAERSAGWLPGYALYMALKGRFDGLPWNRWPEEIRLRKADAVARYEEELSDEIRFQVFVQYEFAKQWDALREYAHGKGIRIIGDLPIYVAPDSADAWLEPQFFQLDENMEPLAVAGCPPDVFSEEGQHWGNPLYDWDAMRADGFGWWIRRIDRAAQRYDVLRIDHFRGLESYWSVPPKDTTAVRGHWEKGPGMDLLGVLTSWFPGIKWIAEDLGFLTPEVHELRMKAGLPGMKVLSFAFDPSGTSLYLPHRYGDGRCVCYTGTHDNAPVGAFIRDGKEEDVRFAMEYLGAKSAEDVPDQMIRAGMASSAEIFVAQIQDYLGLGAEARINTPGTFGSNWEWRLTKGMTDAALASKIARLGQLYDRNTDRG